MPGAWTAPSTWTSGQIVTDTQLNAQLRDNLLWLGGTGGIITQVVAAVATGTNPTTTSTSPVPLIDPTLTITTLAGSSLLAIAQLTVSNTAVGAVNSFFLGLNSTATTGGVMTFTQGAAGGSTIVTLTAVSTSTSAATQTLEVFWACSSGTLTRNGFLEGIICVEIRR